MSNATSKVLSFLFGLWRRGKTDFLHLLRGVGNSDSLRFLRTHGMGSNLPEDESAMGIEPEPRRVQWIGSQCPFCNEQRPIFAWTVDVNGTIVLATPCFPCKQVAAIAVPAEQFVEMLTQEFTPEEVGLSLELLTGSMMDDEPELGEQENGWPGQYL